MDFVYVIINITPRCTTTTQDNTSLWTFIIAIFYHDTIGIEMNFQQMKDDEVVITAILPLLRYDANLHIEDAIKPQPRISLLLGGGIFLQ